MPKNRTGGSRELDGNCPPERFRATYRAGRYAIRTSDYPSRVPETIVPPERLFMRLVKGSLAGLVLTGILAIVPAAAFAHGGGGGGGGGNGGGGGGHGIGGGGRGQ